MRGVLRVWVTGSFCWWHLCLLWVCTLGHLGYVQAEIPTKMASPAEWFDSFKVSATDEELYRFLYAMPKGGDLHNHMSGSARSEWFLNWALAEEKRGYIYYTKVKINNCRDYGTNEFGGEPYLMMFINIQESEYQKLSPCEQSEYVPLAEMSAKQKQGWLNSLRLDKSYEGRDEFFQTHWQRLNYIYANPYISAENLAANIKAFAAEGMSYIEPQIGVRGYVRPDGSGYSPEEVADVYRERLLQKDVVDTGMTFRLQLSVLRFSPFAEDSLRFLYQFAYENSDLWVAVNFVGREDNDKGYPLRFLDTLRELRKQYHGVHLSIHAGEVDEPNKHIKDSLLLGAERIGHGINLITDANTMLLMRDGPYMVEINLISNLLLEYVDDYSQHPFPEYLRMGIPVALSTDDRGMWDSNMTDEFFIAVKEFNLSWDEVTYLSRNSLKYSFAPDTVKSDLLKNFEKRIRDFEEKIQSSPGKILSDDAISYGFICRQYELCSLQP